MRKVAHEGSLTTLLKQIPSNHLPDVYPVVLLLCGIAVAESYGLLACGSVQSLASRSDYLLPSIGEVGLELNNWYGPVLPCRWVDQTLCGDNKVEPDTVLIRAIAQSLVTITTEHSLDATWLGKIHELLLGDAQPSIGKATRPNPPTLRGRKCQGAYYTPAEIVDYMVSQTITPNLENQSEPLRIIDPACGGGVFLLTTYRYLLRTFAQKFGRSLSLGERIDSLQQSIFGVDLDKQAVIVTRLALQLECLRQSACLDRPSRNDIHRLTECLPSTIRHGNALIEDGDFGLMWETAFPDVMADGGFDIVLGNPPYLDSEGMSVWVPQWRQYCTSHYVSARGNWDLFCVFIEKALTLCKPGGYHSFIVPNKLAVAPYASAVRSLLTAQSVLHSIRDYSQAAVFSAAVYPLVYVVQKRSPIQIQGQSNYSVKRPIRYEYMARNGKHVQQSTWLPPDQFTMSNARWLLSPAVDRAAIVLRLCQQFSSLETVAQVQGAATVSEAYDIKALIHTQDPSHPEAVAEGARALSLNTQTSSRSGHRSSQPDTELMPTTVHVINSGTIDRYCSLWATKRLRYLGTNFVQPVVACQDLEDRFPRRFQQATAAKIIVASMTKRLECIADIHGTILAGKSTSIIRPYDLPLLYVLGILNSEPMHQIVIQCFGSNSLQGGYLRIGPPQLKSLPIPLPEGDLGDRLVQHVEHMIRLQHQHAACFTSNERTKTHQLIQATDQTIDQISYQLYHLSSYEINLLTASAG